MKRLSSNGKGGGHSHLPASSEYKAASADYTSVPSKALVGFISPQPLMIYLSGVELCSLLFIRCNILKMP